MQVTPGDISFLAEVIILSKKVFSSELCRFLQVLYAVQFLSYGETVFIFPYGQVQENMEKYFND